MTLEIHPTAIVHPKARLASGVTVGAYSIIGEHVEIGEGTKVGPHVVIDGHTRIGSGNKFYQFCSVGSEPQDLKFKGEASELIIGDNNTVREYVTLQPGTAAGSMVSKIGNSNLFMVGSHVGHDAIVGSGNVFANYCCLAGHVTIEDKVTIGGLSGIHQFVRIGQLAILGAGAMVAQDVPPFCIAQGDHARLIGINKVGISRAGYTSQDIAELRKLFRQLFWTKKSNKNDSGLDRTALSALLLEFVRSDSKRGIAAANKKVADED
jgi:UDP-N-acetylglucosamine acyltransferase